MLDVSVWELGVIVIVALLVVGPERLPKVARSVGCWLGRGRRWWATIKKEVAATVDEDDNGNTNEHGR